MWRCKPSKPELYEIRVKGHLEQRRMQNVEGVELIHLPNGQTRLLAPIPDQSALYGLLNRLRDLGIPLISVNIVTGE